MYIFAEYFNRNGVLFKEKLKVANVADKISDIKYILYFNARVRFGG